MLSFRTRAEMAASVAILIALAILVGTGLFMLFVPKPTVAASTASKVRSQRELDERIRKLEENKTLTAATVVSQVWGEPVEEIGPKALESITAYARTQKLKLMAFRPQKTVEVDGLIQLPFLISVEGSYPNIIRFVRQLESGNLKMGTSLVQVSSTDPNSDLVSASIGIVAYKSVSSIAVAKGNTNATKKEN